MGLLFRYTYANGKEVPLSLPYNTAGLILKGNSMEAIANNTLLALLERAEVVKNIEAEAQRRAKIQEQISRAMDRVSREWR